MKVPTPLALVITTSRGAKEVLAIIGGIGLAWAFFFCLGMLIEHMGVTAFLCSGGVLMFIILSFLVGSLKSSIDK